MINRRFPTHVSVSALFRRGGLRGIGFAFLTLVALVGAWFVVSSRFVPPEPEKPRVLSPTDFRHFLQDYYEDRAKYIAERVVREVTGKQLREQWERRRENISAGTESIEQLAKTITEKVLIEPDEFPNELLLTTHIENCIAPTGSLIEWIEHWETFEIEPDGIALEVHEWVVFVIVRMILRDALIRAERQEKAEVVVGEMEDGRPLTINPELLMPEVVGNLIAFASEDFRELLIESYEEWHNGRVTPIALQRRMVERVATCVEVTQLRLQKIEPNP